MVFCPVMLLKASSRHTVHDGLLRFAPSPKLTLGSTGGSGEDIVIPKASSEWVTGALDADVMTGVGLDNVDVDNGDDDEDVEDYAQGA